MISTAQIYKLLGVAVAVIVFGAVGYFFFTQKGSNPGAPAPQAAENSTAPTRGITSVAFTRSAYDVALARAKQWHADAALEKMTLVNASTDAWDFTFVSPSTKGKGFDVTVYGEDISTAMAIPVSGGGATLPSNITSPTDAMASAHAVPGFSGAAITSMELIYNAVVKQWYWGVKTATGATITIKATQ